MKVRVTHAVAGANFSIKPGELVEMTDEEAKRFVGAGAGVLADQPADAIRKIPKPPAVVTQKPAAK